MYVYACQCVSLSLSRTLTNTTTTTNTGTEDLLKKVCCPVLLMPASNDPDDYRAGGSFLTALQEANTNSTSTDKAYDEVTHGFLPRGDVSDKDSVVTASVKRAMKEIDAWLVKNA